MAYRTTRAPSLATHRAVPRFDAPPATVIGRLPWRRPFLIGAAASLLLGGFAAFVGGGLPPKAAGAQQVPHDTSVAGITVVGDGIVKAQPDTTTLRLGVDVTTTTPAEALTQTRERADRVIARLRERGIPEADIQTSSFNVYPINSAPREPAVGTPPAPTGYRGSATVTSLVADVSQVSALLSAAFDAGANTVQGLTFGIRDDSALRQQALQAAITAARPKAEAAASAAGLRLAGVRTVVEQSTGAPLPLGAQGLGGGGGEGTAPGQMAVAVRAEVTFNVTA
jgi:uncharacterized protein